MFTKKQLSLYFVIGVLTGMLLLFVAQVNQPLAADMEAPPRPTLAPPDVEPIVDSVSGSKLSLQVQYSEDWPFDEKHWQDVYVTVRWVDNFGNWHPVEGWESQVDEIEQKDGAWVARKEWWVGTEQLGSGPYRYFVYESEDGALLYESESFMFPERNGETMAIKNLIEIE